MPNSPCFPDVPFCSIVISLQTSRAKKMYLKKKKKEAFLSVLLSAVQGEKSNLCSPLWAEQHKCALYARAAGCYAPSVHTHRNTGLTSTSLWFSGKLAAAPLGIFLPAQAGNDHVCCYDSVPRCWDFCDCMGKSVWFDLLRVLPAPMSADTDLPFIVWGVAHAPALHHS